MAIPFQTTHITITRSTLLAGEAQDPYDPPSEYPSPTSTTVATGVRAVVTVPGSQTALVAGQRVTFDTQVTLDPCDLQAGDVLTEDNGFIWECLSATPFAAFAISGVKASVRRVKGFSA